MTVRLSFKGASSADRTARNSYELLAPVIIPSGMDESVICLAMEALHIIPTRRVTLRAACVSGGYADYDTIGFMVPKGQSEMIRSCLQTLFNQDPADFNLNKLSDLRL